MKKLYITIVFLFALSSTSRAQTQFPFYGYELSNYEVGDSLEYVTTTSVANGESCEGHDLYCIINKESLSGNDSIRYTIRSFSNSICNIGSNFHGFSLLDTLKAVINNDTVYKNDNNLLGFLLYAFDDSSAKEGKAAGDTSFIQFDTVNGNKKLHLQYSSSAQNYGYDAEQNIGITSTYQNYEDQGQTNFSTSLEYYHLAHGGTGGTLTQLYDNVIQPPIAKFSASIRYDNNGNAFLLLSSTQNLDNSILSIFDLLGRNVKTLQVTNGSNLIDMQTLPKGMYLYKAESNGNILGQGKLMNMTN
jgi:hypothetical protein